MCALIDICGESNHTSFLVARTGRSCRFAAQAQDQTTWGYGASDGVPWVIVMLNIPLGEKITAMVVYNVATLGHPVLQLVDDLRD